MINAAPLAQSSSNGAIGLQCVIFLLIIGGAIFVLLNLKAKTQDAPPLSRRIQTGFAPPVIMQMARDTYRGYSITGNPSSLLLSGMYLTTGQTLLLLLLTGIIPGALLYYFLLGRTEELIIDTSRWEEYGHVTLNARGIRAIERAQNLISKLEALSFTGAQASMTESILIPADLPPLGVEAAELLNNLKHASAKRRWATIQKLAKQPVNDPRIVAELQRLMLSDPVDYVRQEAIKAMNVSLYQEILKKPKASNSASPTATVSSAPS